MFHSTVCKAVRTGTPQRVAIQRLHIRRWPVYTPRNILLNLLDPDIAIASCAHSRCLAPAQAAIDLHSSTGSRTSWPRGVAGAKSYHIALRLACAFYAVEQSSMTTHSVISSASRCCVSACCFSASFTVSAGLWCENAWRHVHRVARHHTPASSLALSRRQGAMNPLPDGKYLAAELGIGRSAPARSHPAPDVSSGPTPRRQAAGRRLPRPATGSTGATNGCLASQAPHSAAAAPAPSQHSAATSRRALPSALARSSSYRHLEQRLDIATCADKG